MENTGSTIWDKVNISQQIEQARKLIESFVKSLTTISKVLSLAWGLGTIPSLYAILAFLKVS